MADIVQMDVQYHSASDLLDKLRETKLRGSSTQPYKNAHMEVRFVEPSCLTPCQRYVLSYGLSKIEKIRWELLPYCIDIFELEGYCSYGEWDILPPIVEEEWIHNRPHLLVADGLHRSFLALQHNVPIKVVLIRKASPPYYAHPLRNGWDGVEVIDKLEEGYIKKFHRFEHYRAYFRDYQTAFRKVGDSRKVELLPSENNT